VSRSTPRKASGPPAHPTRPSESARQFGPIDYKIPPAVSSTPTRLSSPYDRLRSHTLPPVCRAWTSALGGTHARQARRALRVRLLSPPVDRHTAGAPAALAVITPSRTPGGVYGFSRVVKLGQ
jgi:hypothetical protein